MGLIRTIASVLIAILICAVLFYFIAPMVQKPVIQRPDAHRNITIDSPATPPAEVSSNGVIRLLPTPTSGSLYPGSLGGGSVPPWVVNGETPAAVPSLNERPPVLVVNASDSFYTSLHEGEK